MAYINPSMDIITLTPEEMFNMLAQDPSPLEPFSPPLPESPPALQELTASEVDEVFRSFLSPASQESGAIVSNPTTDTPLSTEKESSAEEVSDAEIIDESDELLEALSEDAPTKKKQFSWNPAATTALITLAGESLQGPQGALTWDSIPWKAIAKTLETDYPDQGTPIPNGCSVKLRRVLASNTISNIQFPSKDNNCFKKLTTISKQLQQGWKPKLPLPCKERKWTKQPMQTLIQMASSGEYPTLDQLTTAFNVQAALAGFPQATESAIRTELSRIKVSFIPHTRKRLHHESED